MKTPVFCDDCKFYKFNDLLHPYTECNKILSVENTYYGECITCYTASKQNAKNDCIYYKPTWWRKIFPRKFIKIDKKEINNEN